MKRRRTLTIALVVALGLLLLGYFVITSPGGGRFQWYESYDATSDQPYGTTFIRGLLRSYRENGDFIFNETKPVHELLDSADYPAETDYVFIGQSAYLDERDVAALMKFIDRGNDVLIASLEAPGKLLEMIYESHCNVPVLYNSNNRVDQITMQFYHDSLQNTGGYNYSFRFAGIDRPYYWAYLDEVVFCDSTVSIAPLGFQTGDLVNFFKIPYGRGNLFLHTNPLVFTNYFLTKADKIEYAAGVFTHLRGRHIIWDEYSKLPFAENNNAYNSPLYFIMQQPSLKYAWWMILVALVLFVVLAVKRKQRIIPVLEAKMNTSLEFVTMISSLHYQNGDHLDMARKKMKYFLYFIRAKYGIHTPSFTQAHVPVLAEKAKVKQGDVQLVFDRWHVIETFSYSSIEVNRLVELYSAIDSFYKTCK